MPRARRGAAAARFAGPGHGIRLPPRKTEPPNAEERTAAAPTLERRPAVQLHPRRDWASTLLEGFKRIDGRAARSSSASTLDDVTLDKPNTGPTQEDEHQLHPRSAQTGERRSPCLLQQYQPMLGLLVPPLEVSRLAVRARAGRPIQIDDQAHRYRYRHSAAMGAISTTEGQPPQSLHSPHSPPHSPHSPPHPALAPPPLMEKSLAAGVLRAPLAVDGRTSEGEAPRASHGFGAPLAPTQGGGAGAAPDALAHSLFVHGMQPAVHPMTAAQHPRMGVSPQSVPGPLMPQPLLSRCNRKAASAGARRTMHRSSSLPAHAAAAGPRARASSAAQARERVARLAVADSEGAAAGGTATVSLACVAPAVPALPVAGPVQEVQVASPVVPPAACTADTLTTNEMPHCMGKSMHVSSQPSPPAGSAGGAVTGGAWHKDTRRVAGVLGDGGACVCSTLPDGELAAAGVEPTCPSTSIPPPANTMPAAATSPNRPATTTAAGSLAVSGTTRPRATAVPAPEPWRLNTLPARRLASPVVPPAPLSQTQGGRNSPKRRESRGALAGATAAGAAARSHPELDLACCASMGAGSSCTSMSITTPQGSGATGAGERLAGSCERRCERSYERSTLRSCGARSLGLVASASHRLPRPGGCLSSSSSSSSVFGVEFTHRVPSGRVSGRALSSAHFPPPADVDDSTAYSIAVRGVGVGAFDEAMASACYWDLASAAPRPQSAWPGYGARAEPNPTRAATHEAHPASASWWREQ